MMHRTVSPRRLRAVVSGGLAFSLALFVAGQAAADPQPSSVPPGGSTTPAPAADAPVAPSAPTAATGQSSVAGIEKKRRHRLEWDERWHRFRVVEYVTTATTGAAAIGVFWFATPSDHPKWIGPILFDQAVRNAFHLHTRTGILAAEAAASTITIVLPAQSLLDSVVLPALDGNFDLMWQLGMMDAQAYALSGLVTASMYDTIGRARPSYEDCKAGTSIDPYCNAGEFASFPSGHTAAAWTGAGLLCAHHGALSLYGSGALDIAACIEGVTLATADGVLRLMADRHWVSDVLTGGAIGFFTGYGLPMLLHYWKRPPGEVVNRPDLKVAILAGAGVTPFGLQVRGVF